MIAFSSDLVCFNPFSLMIIINPIHGISKCGNESGVITIPDYVAIFSQKKKKKRTFQISPIKKQQQQTTTDIGICWVKKSTVSMNRNKKFILDREF